jgi:hypothetical protein
MKKIHRRLALKFEQVRALTAPNLEKVAGGVLTERTCTQQSVIICISGPCTTA